MSLLAAVSPPLTGPEKAILCLAIFLGLVAVASILRWRRRR